MNRSDRQRARANAIARCRERGILIPTFGEMREPGGIDPRVRASLQGLHLQAVDPRNLFRITWKNAPDGGFGPVNALEIPPAISGVPARIVGLLGSRFPTGAHKVGAAFGCLVPRLVSGDFDPSQQVAVWPSTGNYCRGGAFDSVLLGCRALAILPEEMSRERFRWLEEVGAEILATPGCESNVKEIFDACHEIRRTRPEAVIFNQFDEFGNYLWHRGVTGPAVEELVTGLPGAPRLAAWVSATGSGGTLAAGDHLKQVFAGSRIVAAEALQCPTLLRAGFGGHRIEGIGDKHVPWIHNARNTDAICAVDDEDTMRLLRLFNEPAGHEYLRGRGVDEPTLAGLPELGISSICNLIVAIRAARWFEFGEDEVLVTSFTDPASMYHTRLDELRAALGPYDAVEARVDHERRLLAQGTDHFRELSHPERRAIHNLKYFTWVEQQGRSVEELEALWRPGWWDELAKRLPEWDQAIRAFNAESGVLQALHGEEAS
jgi:cysteine synthase